MLKQMSRPTTTELLQPFHFKVRAGDTFLLMGTRGSGKTTAGKLIDNMLSKVYPYHRHYILDAKHDGDFDSYPGIVTGDLAPERPTKNQRYQVWQPILEDAYEIEKWFKMIELDRPAFLMIDELATLVYKKNTYSQNYTRLQKLGRSLPVGTITHTQELSQIPSNAYKQAVHRFGFYLEGEYDKRIRNMMLKHPDLDNPEHEYGFWYQHQNGRGEPQYFESIQHFLGIR